MVVVVVRLVIMMVVVVMVHVRHHDLFDFDYRGRFMLTMVLKMLMILASTLCQRSGKNTRHSKKFPCLYFSSGFFCHLGGGGGSDDDDDNSDDVGDDGDVMMMMVVVMMMATWWLP